MAACAGVRGECLIYSTDFYYDAPLPSKGNNKTTLLTLEPNAKRSLELKNTINKNEKRASGTKGKTGNTQAQKYDGKREAI